ncbi:unnamed protein product [Closterium sp. NIES-65]|nr:unnamed protein product [Closterium sp. NIES-65]
MEASVNGDLSWGEWGWGSGGGRGRGRRVVRDRSMGGKEVVASEGWRKWWEGVGGGGESGRDGGKGMGVREGGVRRWRRGGGARQRGVSPLDIPAETSRSERELRALGLLAGEAGSGGRAGRLTGRQEEPAWWREACIGAAGMAASPAVAPDMRLQLYTWSLPTRIPYPPFPLPPQLYTAYRRSGATVGIDSDNSRDALFRAAINTAFSAAAGWVHSSLIPSLPPPGHCMPPSPPSPHPFASFASHGHQSPLLDADPPLTPLPMLLLGMISFSPPRMKDATPPLLHLLAHAPLMLPTHAPHSCSPLMLPTHASHSCSPACGIATLPRPFFLPFPHCSDIPLFLACLAAAVRLPSPRALTMVLAALAARTRSSFLQAWALVKQNRRSEAEEELQRLASIATTLPPPPNSAEMETVVANTTTLKSSSPISDASTHSSLQSPISDASTHSSLQSPLSDASTHSSLQSPLSDASTHSSLQSPISDASTHSSLQSPISDASTHSSL